jgi:hypothetical protein
MFGSSSLARVVVVVSVVVAGSAARLEGQACASGAVPVAGFLACDRLDLAPADIVGGLAFTPAGDLVVYAGGALRLHGAAESRVLRSFDPPVFGSFVKVAPGRDAVVFGESSAGNIYLVPLDVGGGVVTDNIPFAYDLDFDAQGRGLVSTTLSFGGAQMIVLLDGDPERPPQPVVTGIPGFSGPLAFDPEGNLYYGTADLMAATQSLYRFRREDLEGAIASGPIDFAAGEEVLSEIGGFSSMLWHAGTVYFSDLGFAAGIGSVQAVDTGANYAVSGLATFPSGEAFVSPTYIAFRPGTFPFFPGAGAEGGALAVVYSDFATINRVAEVVPQLFFVRGEVNADGEVNITDGIDLLNFLFLGGAPPEPVEAADINDDTSVDIGDAVYLFNFLFLGGQDIPAPFPDPGPG